MTIFFIFCNMVWHLMAFLWWLSVKHVNITSLTRLQFASERLASNYQSAAAAIVVCIAARVLNKMWMMTTVRVGLDIGPRLE